ncbi:hypothetical protein G7Z17_g2334 [Cylindrodendrum hubeiense]|uniref:MYND-type domain-containing protein n=1 Tax=Cylindrodendrum hubeiense TaxID=595255 RepID=A0A9P5HHW3_9HYPO|nr:hypothetical protein G7Z17_g2334 [Cylindrodendrum hubeiense]
MGVREQPRVIPSRLTRTLYLCLPLATAMNIHVLDLMGAASPKPTGSPGLSEEAIFGRKNCTNCGKPESSIWCQQCAEGGVGQLRIFYCSKPCQDQHAVAHRDVCEARRLLSRAVSIFMELWTTFEENTFSSKVRFVNERNGKIFLRLRSARSDEGTWMGKSFLEQFPGDAVPENARDALKKAVLFDNACTEVFSVGLSFVKILLKRGCLQEANIKVKDPALVVDLAEHPTLAPFGHNLLRVKLTTGEIFAIDFTGAQFGWRDQLYTWDTYVQHRVKEFNSLEPLGGAKQQDSMVYCRISPTSIGGASRAFRTDVVNEGLVKGLVTYFVQHETTVKKLLSLPPSLFVRERAQLVNHLKHSIRTRVQKPCDLGIGRLYFDDQFESHVVSTSEEALKYQNVWLSKEEYSANKGNLKALRYIWKKKVASSS